MPRSLRSFMRCMVLVMALFCSSSSYASHIFGIDLYYTYISGTSYTVTLVVYGDCAGSAFPELPSSTPEVDLYDGDNFNEAYTLTGQAPTNGLEVTPVCPADIDNTTCSNPSNPVPGVKKFVYSTTVTVPYASTTWRFVFSGQMGNSEAGRSNNITNVVIPTGLTGSLIGLVDTLNNVPGPNSDLVFSTIPTPFFCLNVPANYNPGAIDANNDSDAFQLISAFDAGIGGPVTYISPYTATNPLQVLPGTFSFTNATAQLSFTPNGIQKSLVVYNGEKFSNGVLVGTCQREMTFVVLGTCNDDPPQGSITNASAGTIIDSTHFSVCASQGNFTFSINPIDLNNDDIAVSVAGLPSGATFNVVNNNTVAPLGTFSWNTAGVVPGNYTFYVTYQDNGCPLSSKQTQAYTIAVLPDPTVSFALVSAATCARKGVFHLTLAVSPGPWSINISQGSTVLQSLTNITTTITDSLQPGTYTVRTFNANNCEYDTTITIAPPPAITPSVAIVAPSCPTSADGSATVTATGGISPYEYSIGTGTFSTINTFNDLTAGSYTVHVIDTDFCIKDTSISIISPVQTHAVVTLTKPPCNSFQNGVIVISAFNSVAPYQYALGTGTFGTSDTFNNLYSGSYLFHIKNALGCVVDTTIVLPDSVKIHATTPVTNISCNGAATGNITINASGAYGPPFTYSINSGAAGSSNTFPGLTAGSYSITVLDTSNCYFDTTLTITQPSAISVSNNLTNISCNAGSDGSVAMNVTGGTPGYSYDINGGTFGASNTFSGLAAGTYVFQIVDANNCLAQDTATLTQPDPIQISYSLVSLATCTKKAVFQFTPAGIASPWHINMSQGATVVQTFTGVTGPATDSLAPGTYTFSTFNSNNCEIDTTIVIAPPPAITPSFALSPTCVGGSTGIIIVAGGGGLPPFDYSIGSGAYSTTDTFTQLAVGTYTVKVTDSNRCVFDTSIAIINGDSIHASVLLTKPPCNAYQDGIIIISATNSQPPYQYAIGTDTYGTTDTFANLYSGNYAFHIQDSMGCVLDTVVTLPDSLKVTANLPINNILCHGDTTGIILVNATGAFGPPYTYSLNGATPVADSLFPNLPAGSYTMQVVDPNQCHFDTTVNVIQPTAIALAPNVTNVSCYGAVNGTIVLNTLGGTQPYIYSIDTASPVGSNTFSNLDTGTYIFTVTDTNSCIKMDTLVITQPAPLIISSITTTEPLCFDTANGSYQISATGGTLPYTYTYNTAPYISSSTLSGLLGGNYTLYVKDAHGCITDTAVTLAQPTPISLTASVTPSTCSTLANGIVVLSDTGGTPGYTYAQGTGAYVADSIFTPLAAGTYIFYIKDNHNCIKDTTIVIHDSLHIHGSFAITPAVCYQQANGIIAVSGLGGYAPYQYAIGTGTYSTADTFSTEAAGSYTVYIQDSNGCIGDSVVSVSQPDNILPSVTWASPSCYGYSDGSLSVSSTGGTPSYTFALDTSAYVTSNAFSGLAAGTDTVFIQDSHGCISDTIITITQPTQLVIDSLLLSDVKCYGTNTGWVLVSASGATPGYTYGADVNGTQANDTVANLSVGSSTIFVKDSHGCVADTSITLTQPAPLVFAIDSNVNPTCAGFTNGFITVTAGGGVLPYLYSMNSGTYSDTDIYPNLIAGTYTIAVQDSNSCVHDTSIALIGYPPLIVGNLTVTNPRCYGLRDGAIVMAADGGVPAFTYQVNRDTTQYPSGTFDSLAQGTYKITITDTKNCVLDTTIKLVQPDSLALTTSEVPNDCIGYDNGGGLTVNVSGGTQPYAYLWSGNQAQTTATLSSMPNGNYMVLITDANNCTDSTFASITYDDCCKPFVADAFTPNGDSKNDVLHVRFKGDMQLKTFSIFNRYGQKVFETINIDQGWNGTFNGVPQDMGVYFWYVKAICGNRGDHEIEMKGDVTLIR